MRRLGWRPHGVVVLAATVLLAVVAAQAGAVLPDGRGYELVSPLDTNGNGVYSTKMTADGERVAIAYQGGIPGSSAGGFSLLVADRTPSGWQQQSILPPTSELLGTNYIAAAATPDLTSFIAAASIGAPTPKAIKLVRLDDDGNQTLLHAFDNTLNVSITVAASDDLRRAYASVLHQIDAGHAPSTRNVYDFGSGTPVLVSRMPDGSVPLCGVQNSSLQSFYPSSGGFPTQHRVSVDGRRVFFPSRANGPCGSAPIDLYMRDVDAGTTTLISAPPVSGANGGAVFLQATPDGSSVFYATTTRLDVADANATRDIYRYTVGSGNTCVTCLAANANVTNPGSTDLPIVTEDGSRVYFTTTSVLSGADTDGGKSAYVVDGGTITYVAPVDGIHPSAGSGGQTTVDGSVVLFRSSRSQLNALTGSDNGGTSQYYRYERRSQTLTCISCPRTGAASVGVPEGLAGDEFIGVDNTRVMSDDGSLIVFKTAEALVAQDTNQDEDLYRWRDGQVALLTDGVTAYSALFGTALTAHQVAGVSGDGEDVHFLSYSKLLPQVVESGQPNSQLYDARVGGGFPLASPPITCGDGEACLGSPTAPPSLLDLGSARLQGDGNAVEEAVARVSVARVTRAQRRSFARTGRLRLQVRANVDGELSATARARIGRRTRVVADAARSADAGDRVSLTLRLSGEARRALASQGRLTVTAVIRSSETSAAKRTVLRLTLPATANGR